jgi:hypothetical protein
VETAGGAYYYYEGFFCGGGEGRGGGVNDGGGRGGGASGNAAISKRQAACAADVAINYALGFIPGYNAAKFIASAAGINTHFIENGVNGTSFVTARPTALSGINALASAYSAISLQAFINAGGTSLKALPTAGAITELGKIASTAGTIANLVNTVSAGVDLYQCFQKP